MNLQHLDTSPLYGNAPGYGGGDAGGRCGGTVPNVGGQTRVPVPSSAVLKGNKSLRRLGGEYTGSDKGLHGARHPPE